MKLIVEKYSITDRAWKLLHRKSVTVKITPKRIVIVDGVYRGKKFDHNGRCVDRRYPGDNYRYSVEAIEPKAQ